MVELPTNVDLQRPEKDSGPWRASQDRGVRTVLSAAIVNTVYFVIGTFAIILIGQGSWFLGLILAGIEALFAAFQLLKVLFIVAANITLFIFVRTGEIARPVDETEMRWASLIRIVELGIWMGCLVILYRFFFP